MPLQECSVKEEMKRPAITVVDGTSVLMAAVARGDTAMAKDLLDILGRHLLLQATRALVLPVHVAAAKGNVEFLEAAVVIEPAVVHCEDVFGCTPVFYAVQGGWLSTLRFLVEKANASLRIVNIKGRSLLHAACIAGDADVVSYLLDKMDMSAITAKTKDKSNAIHCAAYHGKALIVAQLLTRLSKKKKKEFGNQIFWKVLSARDACGSSALHLAAIGNHVETALYLVEAGADVAQLNRQHQTAREVALSHGHRAFAHAFADAHQVSGTAGKTLEKRRDNASYSEREDKCQQIESNTSNENSVGLLCSSSLHNKTKDACASETRASNLYISRRAPHSTSPIDVHAACHKNFAKEDNALENHLSAATSHSPEVPCRNGLLQTAKHSLNADGSDSSASNDELTNKVLSTAERLDRFLKEMADVLQE